MSIPRRKMQKSKSELQLNGGNLSDAAKDKYKVQKEVLPHTAEFYSAGINNFSEVA